MDIIQSSFSEPNKIPQVSSLDGYQWDSSLPSMSSKSWECLLNLTALSLTITLLTELPLGRLPQRFPCPLRSLRNSFPQGRVLTGSLTLQHLSVQTQSPSFPAQVIWTLLLSLSRISLRPQGLYPARLLCPWGFPGKNTGVGCHFLLQGNLPDSGIKPASPELAGKFFTAEPTYLIANTWATLEGFKGIAMKQSKVC